jgi:phage/plasmid-associated DNA primase
LRQILVGCVEKEILVFIGAGDCGKSTVLEKIFRKALTVEIGQQRQTFVVDSMGGRFASAGSHLAHLTVIDDTTDTIGGKALQTFLKTITNTTRVVEYKGITPFSVNNSMGCIINLNGPFFIKQQHLKACMNRFVIIDFTKVFEKSRDFERKELDRSTLINMALNQTT